MKYIAAFFTLCLIASAAGAVGLRVDEKILQKGIFIDAACTPEQTPGYNACLCDGDIRYPEISGLDNIQVQVALNAGFRQAAEKTKCTGMEAKKEGKDDDHSAVSHRYEQTFFSPAILGLEFTDWSYTGGAHGNGTINGAIIDLQKGKILSINDLIEDKSVAELNKIIYDTLSAKPEEEVFHAQIESRKGAFIKNGVCQGCTLVLKPDGLHVLFQTYEVASFAEGNMDVPIPVKYVSYPSVIEVLRDHKPVTQK